MLENDISILDKIFIRIAKAMKNKNDIEEIEEIVKFISVSLYYDKKVTIKELEKAEKIIKNVFDTDNTLVSLMVKEKIESYIEGFWNYEKDSEYIFKKIIIEGKWLYAECMIAIFKADGVSKEESGMLKKLTEIVEARKILLNELGLGSE